MDLENFHRWMRDKYAITTIKSTMRYIKRVEIDIDTIENHYLITDWVYDLKITTNSRVNLIKAINRYLKFRNIDYSIKRPTLKGRKDVWRPSDQTMKKILAMNGGWPYGSRNALLMKILAYGGLRCDEARKLTRKNFRTKVLRRKVSRKAHLIAELVEELEKAGTTELENILPALKKVYRNAVRNMAKEESKKRYYINVIGKGYKERNVPIPKNLYQEVMTYFEHNPTLVYLFDNGTGAPISNPMVRRICKKIGKNVDEPRLHAHALRHWRTVDLKLKGVDIDSISKFLGHENISTTMIYLQSLEEEEIQEEIMSKDPFFGQEEIMLKDPFLNKKQTPK